MKSERNVLLPDLNHLSVKVAQIEGMPNSQHLAIIASTSVLTILGITEVQIGKKQKYFCKIVWSFSIPLYVLVEFFFFKFFLG